MSDANAARIAKVTTHADAKNNFRDPGGLWGWMRALSLLSALDYFTIATTSALTWAVYERYIQLSLPAARTVDLVTNWSSRSLIWMLLVSAFATLRLAYRLTRNLKQRAGSEDVPSAGWVCFSYFVPFANLVMPPILTGRIWRATFARCEDPAKGSAIIGFWWTTWLASAVVLTIGSFLARSHGSSRAADAGCAGEPRNAVGDFGAGLRHQRRLRAAAGGGVWDLGPRPAPLRGCLHVRVKDGPFLASGGWNGRFSLSRAY